MKIVKLFIITLCLGAFLTGCSFHMGAGLHASSAPEPKKTGKQYD